MKAARINEVERLFRQITRGSRHLNIKDLEKFIKQPVDPGAIPTRFNDNGDPLPITLSDFKESFKIEL
jgi:hypothetical protein